MANHPNRGWRSRWTVDLERSTATHRDGWVFRFTPVDGEVGVFDGDCVGWPEPLTAEHQAQAARIAREAGDAYVEARNARH